MWWQKGVIRLQRSTGRKWKNTELAACRQEPQQLPWQTHRKACEKRRLPLQVRHYVQWQSQVPLFHDDDGPQAGEASVRSGASAERQVRCPCLRAKLQTSSGQSRHRWRHARVETNVRPRQSVPMWDAMRGRHMRMCLRAIQASKATPTNSVDVVEGRAPDRLSHGPNKPGRTHEL